MKTKIILALAFIITGVLSAQEEVEPLFSNENESPEFKAIQKKYADKFKKLEQASEEIAEDAPEGEENAFGVDIDFSKTDRVSFEIPEFRMKTTEVILDLPSVTMKTKKIVWSEPETKMENRKVGEYPEVHGFTVKMKPIITKVPVVVMKKKEAKIDVPEFSMKQQKISFDIPEIFRTKKVIFDIPRIIVRSTEDAEEETKKGSEEIERSADMLAKAQTLELKELSIQKLQQEKEKLKVQHAAAQKQINDSIASVKKAGADPKNLVSKDGTKTNLIALMQNIDSDFEKGYKAIDDAISKLKK